MPSISGPGASGANNSPKNGTTPHKVVGEESVAALLRQILDAQAAKAAETPGDRLRREALALGPLPPIIPPVCSPEDVQAAKEYNEGWKQGRDEARSAKPSGKTLLRPVRFSVLAQHFPELRPAVIDGLARQGEVVNLIAPPKVGKTILAWNMALCLANGLPWLGRFRTRQGRVLIIDNELHKETIIYRGKLVAKAMGDLSLDNVDVLPLRGKMVDYAELYKSGVENISQYVSIIIDSHYRMLPEGVNENDNAAITQVYNLIDQLASQTEAMWNLIHHSTKGDQSDRAVVDVGAGAGAQSRAADTHLVLRKHAQASDAYVMDAVARSFAPLDPVVLRYKFPIWLPVEPEERLNPNHLESRDTKKAQRDNEKGTGELRGMLGEWRSEKEMMVKTGMGQQRLRRLLGSLVDGGEVVVTEEVRRNNRTRVYRLA